MTTEFTTPLRGSPTENPRRSATRTTERIAGNAPAGAARERAITRPEGSAKAA